MNAIKLKILNREGHTLLESEAGTQISLVYSSPYNEGDRICLETDQPGFFCDIRFEDSMLPAVVFLGQKIIEFAIPFDEKRASYSPKSFSGSQHLITAKISDSETIYARRNLTLNPYDQQSNNEFFSHASANIETRGESVFAARNTIDGIFANASHGAYPYQSWGINQRPDAELKIEFGVPVEADEVRLTLRADFPHDNYWQTVTLCFSDGSTEVLNLEKSALPQIFRFEKKTIEWVVMKDMIKSEEPSPFPALTQLEVWGKVI